jgi:hypothetical protein
MSSEALDFLRKPVRMTQQAADKEEAAQMGSDVRDIFYLRGNSDVRCIRK